MADKRADNVTPISTPIRADARWLTYEEAGQLLGVDPDSISLRARRAGWARQPGNDGRTRVAVPLDVLPKSPANVRPKSTPDAEADSPAEKRADKGGHVPGDEAQTINLLADAVTAFREVEAQLRAERDAAQAALIEAWAAAAQLKDQLGQAQGDLAALREAEAQLQAERDAAQAAVIEAREKAARAEGEGAALRAAADRETAVRQAAEARAARDGSRADQEATARRAAEGELATWSAGGPLARAWRAFRRGR
jgi:septal ring factor EnvC (AmiA/AmiB activator)